VFLLLGCSVLDESLMLPTCQTDEACRGIATGDDCLTLRCTDNRCVPTVLDADGDGAGEAACVDLVCTDRIGPCGARDCDDNDPAVHPGARELCNGLDDDCNGALDGPDEDDDGDGQPDVCARAAITDCDDSDPFTYLGAQERCDGWDNDCRIDGVVRVGGGRVAAPEEDADGDGYAPPFAECDDELSGDPMEPSPPAPYPKVDCDDSDPLVHPDAEELCNGTDNDCNNIPDDWRTGEPGTSCTPIDITAGDAHSCVRMRDQSVVCWGISDFRLAATNLSERSTIIAGVARVPGERRYLDVGAGQTGTCSVLEIADGSTDAENVRCWGGKNLVSPDAAGPTGSGSNRVGIVAGVHGATSVATSADHACAIGPEGVTCWGASNNGAINGNPGDRIVVPETMADTVGATHVDTSWTHTCAVIAGRVRCWGDPASGALGGTPGPDESTVLVPEINDAVEVAVGRCFTCVRHADGHVSCFGDDRYEDDADLSSGCSGPSLTTPRTVAGLDDAVSIDAYMVHACAARADGNVVCWGNNVTRQLGEGTPVADAAGFPREGYDRTEDDPVRVEGVSGAFEVTAGTWHSCALTTEGTWCWGRQVRHRLGNGHFEAEYQDSPRPVGVQVSVIHGPIQILAGGDSSCFRMPDLSLRCSGASLTAESPSCYALPVESGRWGSVLAADVTYAAVCGVTGRLTAEGVVDRTVRCAGSEDQHIFVGAVDAEGVMHTPVEPADVSLGITHACVLGVDGSVHCWGGHHRGQLGRDTAVANICRTGRARVQCSNTALRVELPEGSRAMEIASGADHTCALLQDRTIACWGNNSLGQLGRAPLTSINTVGFVEGLPSGDPVVHIAASAQTSCAIVESGDAWCWGESVTTRPSGPAPRHLGELGRVEQIAIFGEEFIGRAGIRFSTGGLCARLSTGGVWCLGSNDRGRLGGDLPPCLEDDCPIVTSPVASIFDDASNLACGPRHCCATRRAGQVVCWGDRGAGQGADGFIGTGRYLSASAVDLIAFDDALRPPICETPPLP